MTKKLFGLGLASILGLAMMENGTWGLCSAEGDGADDTSGGGTTALTSSEPPAPVEEKVPSLGDAMYGDDKQKVEEKAKEEPAKKQDDTAKSDDKKADDKAGDWKEYVDDPDKTPEENAAAKAEHDKSKPAAKDEKKKDEAPAVKAEEYEFVEVPEGFELDPTVDKEFRDFAAERGWSKDDVKALSGLQVKLYEKQSEAHAERVAAWGDELKTDKEVGGKGYDANMSKAREAKLAFFPEEVNAVLDKTGLGNHPALVKGFVRIGKAMGELGTLPGKAGAAKTSILENLYGTE